MVRLLVVVGMEENAFQKEMSICEDLEMGRNVAHSGNSEQWEGLVRDLKWQWLQQERSFAPPRPAPPPSRAEAQTRAAWPDALAQDGRAPPRPGSQLNTHGLPAQHGGWTRPPHPHSSHWHGGRGEEGRKGCVSVC